MYSFDGINRIITLDNGVISFDMKDLYSRWKDWVRLSDNAKFLPAFANSIGGNPLTDNKNLGDYFFIQNDWLIKPHESDHTLEVNGNIFPIPTTAEIFTTTDGNYQVNIEVNRSSLTEQINRGFQPISESDKQDIVDAVNANSQSTISEADQQAIADKVSENLQPPVVTDPTPLLTDIEEYFRTLHKFSDLKYILRINSNFLLNLKQELGFNASDNITDFLLRNFIINIEVLETISDNQFLLFGQKVNI